MKRTLTLLFTLCCLSQLAHAQQLLQGRVVDAETGEPLPFATIRINDHGTLCNRDGDFAITARDEEVLVVSFIGFEKQEVRADRLPAIVRLRPLAREMREVTVMALPVDDILRNIRKKLHDERRQKAQARSLYFFRTTIERSAAENEMMEGFYDAFSAINIRRPYVISGQTRLNGLPDEKAIKKTNFQKLFSLGPIIYDESFWNYVLQPLSDAPSVRRAFDVKAISLHEEDGRRIYQMQFFFNGLSPRDWQGRALIQGTLYVDAKTYGLLRFEGKLLGMRQTLDGFRMGMDLRFQVGFSHERNYTEVAHISFDGGNKLLSYHCLLFKVDEEVKDATSGTTGNLVRDIQATGYKSSLWDKYEIVKRTESEERMARGE